MSIILQDPPPKGTPAPQNATARAEELLSRIKDYAVKNGQLHKVNKSICPNCNGTHCDFCNQRGVYVTLQPLRNASVAILGGR